jgi:hypothetical protein
MSEAPTQQKTHRKHQMAGYYTAKRAALRADGSRVDARYRKNKEILADRAAFKRLCGRTGYTVKRRELWKIVEKFKRVLNAVEPVVFARPSLVNKRYKIIMPLCMDYVDIVGKYQDALVKAFRRSTRCQA